MSQDFAVGFDFDHTLGIDNKLERTVALELLASLASSNGIAYDVAAAEREIDVAIRTYRQGNGNIDTAVATFFERFAPAGSATLDVALTFRDAVIERAPAHVQALPGAQELLSGLDELGVSYALLTNGWSPLQEEKARLIGFRGSVLVSERVGARKPSRAAFDLLSKQLELPLSQIWYVGDDPETDCAGARTAGANAVWFDWEGAAYAPELPAPNAVIHKLAELIPLLQGKSSAAANSGG
jgi:HAD superfamily hydrolase (TIGR01549 family)